MVKNKRVLLGISGGIAAYKACELVRALVKRGDEVRVVMTKGACEFVQPLTLQVLSGNPVGTTTFDPTYESEIGHIDLARWADVAIVAPATANVIARMAHGMGNDLLTTVLLATQAPVVVAPAMNTQMWRHPRVQANIATLRQTPRHHVVDPDQGELACKEVGPGRLPDPEVLLQAIDRATTDQILEGKEVLVTTGPTREFIDPARFISNPSTGKMGHAISCAALELGASVSYVCGPVSMPPPYGARRVAVTTARQMHGAVMERAASMDFLVMVAAVADWRPAERSAKKVKKAQMSDTLQLERNPDILRELGARFGPQAEGNGPMVIGFAAESDDVVARAKKKMKRKGAHLMVANQIGGPASSFGADETSVKVISNTDVTAIAQAPKLEVARALWQEIVKRGHKD